MRLPEEEISQLHEDLQREGLSGVYQKQHLREEPESRVVELGDADEVLKQC
jgi:hypothetical protein